MLDIPHDPATVNLENLRLMADHIATVDQRYFNMRYFIRKIDQMEISLIYGGGCGTVGCVIGHCIVLDESIMKPLSHDFNYYAWSERFTGISTKTLLWTYLFGNKWSYIDNTPIGASNRIRHFIEHGLPKDAREQILQINPISYEKSINVTSIIATNYRNQSGRN